jgi:hypothetical protein
VTPSGVTVAAKHPVAGCESRLDAASDNNQVPPPLASLAPVDMALCL